MNLFPWLTPISMAMRNLRVRPWRTFLTLLGITLGVAVVLAIDITNRGTLDSIEGVFQRAVGKAELLVVPAGDDETFESVLLETVQGTEGIQVAAPTAWVRTVLANDTADSSAYWGAGGVQVGRTLEVRGIDVTLDPQVRVYELQAGRLPEEGRYEAAITARYATDKKLAIDKDLVIISPGGTESLKITGILADEGIAITNEGAITFIPLDVLQEIYETGDVVNEIAVQVAPGIGNEPQALEAVKIDLQNRLGKDAQAIYPAARGELVPRMLGAYQTGLSLFSIIAIFMGAFLIYNTFSMTVAERTQEIGMLRAIGMNRRQIMNLVLSEAVVLSLFGSALGVGSGVVLARGLTRLLGGIMTVDANMLSVSTTSLVKSIGLGILVTLLAALLPAFNATRISPLEALRARSKSTQRLHWSIWLMGIVLLVVSWWSFFKIYWQDEVLIPASITGFLAMLMGAVLTVPLVVALTNLPTRWLALLMYRNEGSLGSANVRRSVLRTMLTVASLMISLIMIIGVGSLSHTIKEDMESWVDNVLGGDLMVTSPDPMRNNFANQLKSVAGIAVVNPTRFLEVRVAPESLAASKNQRETIVLFAIEPALFRLIGDKEFVEGQGDEEAMWAEFEQGGALFVSSVVAEEYNLERGSYLVLNTRRGAQPFRVVGITTEFTRQGNVITGTYEDLRRWFGESGADQFTLQVAPGYDPEAVGKEVKARYGDRRGIEVQTTQTYKASVLSVFDQATRLFEVLSLIGVIIGAMGVLNTMTMNVLERTREIGGLRSLGMTRSQVLRMVLSEALAMGLVGGLYGLGLGYYVSHLFLIAANRISSYDMAYLFYARPYWISAGIAIVISQVAAAGPARRAGKVNVVEAIKHE